MRSRGSSSLVGLSLLFLPAVTLFITDVFVLDTCLDFGGRYDYETGVCECARYPSPDGQLPVRGRYPISWAAGAVLAGVALARDRRGQRQDREASSLLG